MQDSRVPGPGSPSGSPNPGNLHRFVTSRQHRAATAVEVVVVVVIVVVVVNGKATPLQA